MASEEVQEPAQRNGLSFTVAIHRFRGTLDLLSAGDGERGGWFVGTVSP
jgi:hypothetical protein